MIASELSIVTVSGYTAKPELKERKVRYNKVFHQTNDFAAIPPEGIVYFECVIGFGDNLNDLPMFAACDIKIAVKNAIPVVKAAADYICDTNSNDGVVKWIMKQLCSGGL